MPADAIAVSLVLPCFNEMDHIAESFPKIARMMDFAFGRVGYEIIVVDDGSDDGTRAWLAELSHPHARVRLLDRNRGRGAAVKAGLALSRGAVVGFMDIDCETSEAYLPRFAMASMDGADLVVGRRVYSLSWSPYVLLRHFLSVGYKRVLRAATATRVRDSEVGYKFFSRRFAAYVVKNSRFDDWFWDTEVCLLAELNGLPIEQIDAAFVRNPKKTSTVRLWRDSLRYLKALREFRRLKVSGAYARLAARESAPRLVA